MSRWKSEDPASEPISGYSDAHVHVLKDAAPSSPIDAQFLPAGILSSLTRAGIRSAALNSTSPEDWAVVLQTAHLTEESRLAEESSPAPTSVRVFPSLGVHPWWCDRELGDWESPLAALLEQNPGVGIGEIGLDTYRRQLKTPEADARQTRFFQRQLEMAVELNRPVSIHCVHAWSRLLPILSRTVGQHPLPLLFHGFSGSPEILRDVLRSFPRAFISLASFIRSRNTDRFHSLVRLIPSERLLLESDAETLDGLSTLPSFYTEISQIRNQSFELLQHQTAENLQSIF